MLLGFDKKAPRDSWNDEFIAALRVEALKLLDEPILNLPFSEFLRYYETGSRVEYECICRPWSAVGSPSLSAVISVFGEAFLRAF